jgi:signal transduction histidine kinase
MQLAGTVRQAARDGALALVLVAASLLLAREDLFPNGDRALKAGALLGSPGTLHQHLAWWWAGTAAAVVALLLRTHLPLPAFAVAVLAGLAHAGDLNLRLLGLAILPIDLAAVIILFTIASTTRTRRTGLITLAAAITAHAAVIAAATGSGTQPMPGLRATLADPSSPPEVAAAVLSLTVTPALLLGIAWAVGDNQRTQRALRAAAEQAATDALRDQEQRAALAVATERARITRELHDVIAHGMSVMVVQAQAAQASLRTQPDTADAALDHVIDTGRASLTEMRRVVALVHAPTTLAPEPGVAALPELLDQVRAAGTPVVMHIDGDLGRLPAAVDLSAYRIVQEALTNIRRHAGPAAHATIRLTRGDQHLDIDVCDDGTATNGHVSSASGHPASGHGLRGVAERVHALGGAMTAGPRDTGGFALHVTLPTALSAAAGAP